MEKPALLKMACIFFLFCAATAIASPAQIFSSLANFDDAHGASPQYMSLLQGADGNLYGAASSGGLYGGGTIFRITTGGTLTTLYNFCAQTNCTDGATPYGALVQAADGSFYGITTYGGPTASITSAVERSSKSRPRGRGPLSTAFALKLAALMVSTLLARWFKPRTEICTGQHPPAVSTGMVRSSKSPQLAN